MLDLLSRDVLDLHVGSGMIECDSARLLNEKINNIKLAFADAADENYCYNFTYHQAVAAFVHLDSTLLVLVHRVVLLVPFDRHREGGLD